MPVTVICVGKLRERSRTAFLPMRLPSTSSVCVG